MPDLVRGDLDRWRVAAYHCRLLRFSVSQSSVALSLLLATFVTVGLGATPRSVSSFHRFELAENPLLQAFTFRSVRLSIFICNKQESNLNKSSCKIYYTWLIWRDLPSNKCIFGRIMKLIQAHLLFSSWLSVSVAVQKSAGVWCMHQAPYKQKLLTECHWLECQGMCTMDSCVPNIPQHFSEQRIQTWTDILVSLIWQPCLAFPHSS